MKWPWASREALDVALSEIAELKAERARLLDRVFVLSGQKPLYESDQRSPAGLQEPAPAESKEEASRAAEGPPHRVRRKLSFATLDVAFDDAVRGGKLDTAVKAAGPALKG